MWRVATASRLLTQSLVEIHRRLLMNQTFWARMHGGATHFPIALLMVSVLFDHAAFWWRNESRGREFRAVGFYSLLTPPAPAPAAVLSGLALSRGTLLGKGMLALHHYFVWP